MKKEFSVKKINHKVEIEDMEVNGNPCKAYWDHNPVKCQYDCCHDCGIFGNSPEASVKY